MANPFAGGTERNKLFAYALAKGNSDKGALIFTEHMSGRGLYDVSGGTAIPKVGLATHSAAHSVSR